MVTTRLHASMVPPGDQGDALDYTDYIAGKPIPVTSSNGVRFIRCNLDRGLQLGQTLTFRDGIFNRSNSSGCLTLQREKSLKSDYS